MFYKLLENLKRKMELKIKDNEILHIYSIFAYKLSLAQERLSEFLKAKKDMLYYCSCGNWKYANRGIDCGNWNVNRGIDYNEAYKNQTRYIKMLKNKCRQLDLELKRIKNRKNK